MDIFKDLVSWAKANAKDGANVAEFEELVSKAAPPDDSKQALEYMKAIPSLRSALDAEKNREYDRGFKSYEEKELPEKEKTIRESIRKELNPTESSEQRQIRELREKLESKEKAEALTQKQNALRAKAKEYGVDPEVAADYARYGDDAEDILKRHAEWHKKELDAVKAETARTAFGNRPPVNGGEIRPTSLTDEYNRRLASGDRQGANLVYLQMQKAKKEVNNG
jgi:actin-related protein